MSSARRLFFIIMSDLDDWFRQVGERVMNLIEHVLIEKTLTSAEKLVLCYVLSAGEFLECSQNLLAQRLGLGGSTCERACARLSKQNILQKVVRGGYHVGYRLKDVNEWRLQSHV
jgi:DNA-binding MarR family transcriptional regulator